MSYSQNRIDSAARKALHVQRECHPKIVLMSDCHRGNGSWSDNFLNNRPLYTAALSYYYDHGFTYVELGDGDELWENRSFSEIYNIHSEIYDLFRRFYRENKLFMIFGNHDRVKEKSSYIYRDGETVIPFYESILLKKEGKKSVLLMHGHQGDILNDGMWRLARWLVRYVWRPLELSGFRDPTSAARNYGKVKRAEERFASWAEKNGCILITGHTHKPVLASPAKENFFNCGSCVHPSAITAIEIEEDQITLVKWSTCAGSDMHLYVCRDTIKGPYTL